MSSEEPKHQPYLPANEPGNNDIKANTGVGSSTPEIPNGWENGIDRSTAKENA